LSDDFRILRRRHDELSGLSDRRERRPSPGTATLIGTVFDNGAMPSTIPGQYAVHITSVSGAESAGAAVTTTASGRTAIVTVVGTKAPVVGDVLVARLITGRWVARRGSGAGTPYGITLPGCPCTSIPTTIYMHVQYAAPAWLSGVYPATLQYQTRPSNLAGYLIPSIGYYSNETFETILLGSDTKFRYWFGCSSGLYFVQGLLTDDSPMGYPGHFNVMNWLIGGTSNTCVPFSLTNGSTSNATFAAQGISINGTGPP